MTFNLVISLTRKNIMRILNFKKYNNVISFDFNFTNFIIKLIFLNFIIMKQINANPSKKIKKI